MNGNYCAESKKVKALEDRIRQNTEKWIEITKSAEIFLSLPNQTFSSHYNLFVHGINP